MFYLKCLFLLPLMVFLFQLYSYAISRKGNQKEETCLSMGVSFVSLGAVSFVFRGLLLSFLGLLLLMLGLLLVANGLQRRHKTIFIDRYDDRDGDQS